MQGQGPDRRPSDSQLDKKWRALGTTRVRADSDTLESLTLMHRTQESGRQVPMHATAGLHALSDHDDLHFRSSCDRLGVFSAVYNDHTASCSGSLQLSPLD